MDWEKVAAKGKLKGNGEEIMEDLIKIEKKRKPKLAKEGIRIHLALVHQPSNTLTSDLT